MELASNLLIVVDPGHGGYDNGAAWQSRPEKDDNLNLGLEVRRQLEAQGVGVLMTRDTDEFVSLQDRARIANEAGADLFISLHRNSYTEQTPNTNGVENFIYLTAPQDTAGRAAQLVLDEVVQAGVQSNRGLKRGNYYVLRRTTMPSMLLEMGYIINDEDNRLFDEKLIPYAEAIARGAMSYFGLRFDPDRRPGQGAGGGEIPVPPIGDIGSVSAAQQAMNNRFGSGLALTGVFDDATRRAVVEAIQRELNTTLQAGLAVDGIYGPQTRAAIPYIGMGARGNAAYLLQVLLQLRGYNPGVIDGAFGPATRATLELYQRDHFLAVDGIAGPQTVTHLLES